MKKVLLTGASGFIGRHCIEPLKALGYEVHCTSSRSVYEATEKVIWHKVDLLDAAASRSLIEAIEPYALLHVAWFMEPGKVINDPLNIQWVESSLALLRSFDNHGGKRVVFAGTNFEYDINYGYLSEVNTPRKPDSVYGVAKNSLFELYRAYCEEAGMSSAWGRVFDIYGPYENPHRLVPSVVLSMLKGNEAKTTHAMQIRDYMHVQDVANGLVSILDSELTGDFNIASGRPVTLKQILYEIADIMNTRDLLQIGAVAARENEVPLIVADMRKLYSAAIWSPSYEWREGLENTVEWWTQHERYKGMNK